VDQIFPNLGGREQFDDVDIQLIRSDQENPQSNEVAHAALRITVTTRDPAKVGRLFDAKIIELGLATIPGNTGRGAGGFNGGRATIHWPATLSSQRVTERVHCDGHTTNVLPTQRLDLPEMYYQEQPVPVGAPPTGATQTIAFGRLFGTRSGDKGGNANCGVWARSAVGYSYLYHFLTVEEFKRLLPDMAPYSIERYDMPNLRAMNFYIKGVLATGAASNHRIDKQAKSLGEYLRAKHIDVPEALAADISA
jgi:hypothetical protein